MSLLSMMMSHERKRWICINQSQVSIQAVDQSEASIHLHEHLAAVAGHGGPPLAQLLHQAGHNMLPAPASASVPWCRQRPLSCHKLTGENIWLLREKYFCVLLSLTILQRRTVMT